MNREGKGKRPLKGRGHLPQGELIALGSKGSSKDTSDIKPIPPLKPILPTTQVKKTGSGLPDRKRESPNPLQPLRNPKRPKTTTPTALHSPGLTFDIESLRGSSSPPLPPVAPLEVAADELEKKVLKAEENNDRTRTDGYIMGALKVLRSNRSKPDPGMYLSVFCLLRKRPHLFRSQRVVEFLTNLLKRETSVNLKGVRPNPVIPIMACNILLCAFQEEQDWPESFIKVFVDDSLGDRTWVEHEKCRTFVDNLLTVFSTKLPPRSNTVSSNEGSKLTGDQLSAEVTKADEEESLLKDMECEESISPEPEKVFPRYEGEETQEYIKCYVVDLIRDQLTRRQLVDNTTRNLLRLMSSACGLSDARFLASQRLEVWLQNPKLNRPAQELLMSVALNCNTHSIGDIEVISNIIKMRLKTKQHAAHYITCVRILVEQHEENLGTLIKHIIYNELSQTRNPNNMSLLGVLFQYNRENAAKNLARVFQDLLINREDYLRAIRALLREIVRALRHDLKFVALCRGLMEERKDATFQELETSIKERMFSSVTDLIIVIVFLSITPGVRDAVSAFKRGDLRDVKTLQDFQKNVATIQQDIASWFHTIVPHMFPISSTNYQQCLSKILFMEPPESYSSKDTWPSESERSFLLNIVNDVPVMDDTLTRVTVIGLSPELPIDAAKALKFVETLVQRAANVKTGVHPMEVSRLRFIDAVLDLCVYHHPSNIQLPAGYQPPSLAIANLYWTGWVVILIVAAFNPSNIGGVVWDEYPTLKCLMEMVMTNNFVFPPPTMVESPEDLEELQSLEAQIAAAEKDDILLFETHLAAATTGKTITEENSLLISQLISMVPDGPARKPPQYIIKQLKTLNATIGIGKHFCRCRSPDFLLEIIQRQGAPQSRPWLAELVLSSQESLDVLPVQCLCEFLLLQTPAEQNDEDADEKREMKKETINQVLRRLQQLLFGSEASSESTSETLECFLYRLHSRPAKERDAAVRALSLIFLFNEQEEDPSKDKYKWLLDVVPQLPYFSAILNPLSYALRMACTEELDFQRLQAYVIFLSKHSVDDFAEDVSMELSRLLLERQTVSNNILSQDTKAGDATHCALLNIFVSVVQRALESSSANFCWDTHHDAVYVRWSKNTVHAGKATTLGAYVIHACIMLLTYGAPQNDGSNSFEFLLDTWCPREGDVKMFLPNAGEEILLLPDWLRLKMICSDVSRLVDEAFRNVVFRHLYVFVQSFGIPVQNTSKILEHLDAVIDREPTLINEMIGDNKGYMLQLVGVHHSRGAVGGERFCQFLNDEAMGTPATPYREQRVTPLRSSRHSLEPHETMEIDGDKSNRIKYLVLKIFPFGDKSETFSLKDRTHYGFQLQKIISKEVSHLHKGVNIPETMAEQFIKILINLLQSDDGPSFCQTFFNSPKLAHPFLRMLIARETILEKQGDGSSFPDLVDLLYKHKTESGLVVSLVVKYYEEHRHSPRRKRRAEAPLERIRRQIKHIQCGQALSDEELREMIVGLKDCKNQSIQPGELICVLSWLQSTRSPFLEEFLRSLISLLLSRSQLSSFAAETSQFIEDLISSLRHHCDVSKSRAGGNGAIIDWLPVLDPDIVNMCPLKQRELLFGLAGPETSVDREVSQGLLLLVLLTHSGSWHHLQDSLDWLLGQDKDTRVDPTFALRFVESCLSIPQLWQGKDTKSSKGIETSCNAGSLDGEVLNLSCDQLRCLVMFILLEAEKITKQPDSSSGHETENLFEDRVSLLLRCAKGKERSLRSVVERLQTDSRWSKQLRHQLIAKLYLHLPEVLSWISEPEAVMNLNMTAKAKFGKFDGFFHRMISILSECQAGQAWEDRISGVVLLCRKMASLHPTHIMRHLPMIASLLRGRTHLTSHEFHHQNHFLFFTHVLALLDSLRPYIFDDCPFIQDGLNDALDSFLDLVEATCIKKMERGGVVAKLVEFFQHYLTRNPKAAFEYLHKRMDFLEDLLLDHSELPSLRSLVAVLSVPRSIDLPATGDQTELHRADVVPGSLLVMTPVSTPWSPGQLEPFLKRIGPNQPIPEVLQVLIDLDETSKRRVDILQFFLRDLARLTKDVNEACRTKAHTLITRHLKQNPRDSKFIVESYLECLSSPDPDVVLSATNVLPEITILAAESADDLLTKAFTASTQKLKEVGPDVCKTIQLFNLD